MAITAANFQSYVDANRLSRQFYYFIKFYDSNGNTYKYTDYTEQIFGYLPNYNIDVSTIYYQGSIESGAYSIRPVTVRITNTEKPKATAAYERFTDNFYSNHFETEFCEIRLGYAGIASANDLVDLFVNGYMVEFEYSVMNIAFKVYDRSFLELPPVPTNKFTRANYANAPAEIIGKPIPLVYGRWDYEATAATAYGYRSYVPAIITESDLDTASLVVKFKVADNALDAVTDLFIYDDQLQAVGKIWNTINTTLADAEVEVEIGNYDGTYRTTLMSAYLYLDPDRVFDLSNATLENNMFDGNFSTAALITGGGLGGMSIGFGRSRFGRDDLIPYFPDTTGATSTYVQGVVVELSGYPNGTFAAGESLAISSTNSAWSYSLNNTQVNALSQGNSFNVTSTGLAFVYPEIWDGTTGAFTIWEADDAIGTNEVATIVYPDAGNYPTMTEMAAHLEQKLGELTNATTLSNEYYVNYNKESNQISIIIKTTASPQYFKIVKLTTQSDDLGFTAVSPSYVNTYVTGSQTMLDVPDGDFSYLRLTVGTVTTTSSADFYIQGFRLWIEKRYKDYNLVPTTQLEDIQPSRRLPANLYSTVRNGVGYVGVNNPDSRQSILEEFAGRRFFVAVDGKPDSGSSYLKKGPEIIQDIIENHIGISSSNIDTTAFSAANSATQVSNLAVYQAQEVDSRRLLETLAKYSLGFVHVTPSGKYTMSVVKSSYAPTDVSFTLVYRDIVGSLSGSLLVGYTSVSSAAKDLVFNYQYDWARGRYRTQLTKSTNSTLNIPERTVDCPYFTADTDADAFAELLSGDGDDFGYFGQLKTIVEITIGDATLHRAELGDIIVFDDEWRNVVRIWGREPDSIYFMLVGKQIRKNEITLSLLEVGDTTPDTPAAASGEFDELFGEMF